MNSFLSKVFGWMFLGLLITFATGYVVANNEAMLYNIFSSGMHWILLIAEIVIVIFLSTRIAKMQTMTATILFCLYSFITGLTFSIFFVAYEMSSIITVFGLTSMLFGVFALFGKITKIDLTKFSSIFVMGIFGILIVSIVNIFLGNTMVDIIVCIVGLILFLGLTAYDMQKLKHYQAMLPNENNAAIIGAFELYLDFINIFIKLLRLFGRNRD